MRGGYLALAWPSLAETAAGRAKALAHRLEGEGLWRRAGTTDRLIVWTRPEADLAVQALPCASGFVIGDLFPTPDSAAPKSPLRDRQACWRKPCLVARDLTRSSWGRYVALIHGPPTHGTSVYRDPGGMLECLTWALGDGLHVVASDMTLAPAWLRPPRAFLNWDRIARFLAAPALATTAPLFDDIDAIGPGELLLLDEGAKTPEVIWTAADFARPSTADLPALQQDLVRKVDLCTAALVGGYDKVLMELSGGLDSSILAGALQATGTAGRVAEWTNYLDDRHEADERRYARSVTDRLGVELAPHRKSLASLTVADFAELGPSFWPAVGGVDAGRDRHEVARLHATGARAIVSGQGGDGAFFQFPSALVAADEFRRYGWSALASPVLADVARRTRHSVWDVLDQVRKSRRGGARLPTSMSSLLPPELQPAPGELDHPWVVAAKARGLPPGKVLHVQGIAVTHLYRGPSRRLREAEILLPLFAQPVVELCLSIATPDLAGGSYDRPFARSAFAERLPEVVLSRRNKGNQTAFFAKLVANSLDALRPYLLDGVLAEAGLLDRGRLDQALDPQALIWGSSVFPSDVLMAASVEAWVRHWQGQAPDSPSAPRRRA